MSGMMSTIKSIANRVSSLLDSAIAAKVFPGAAAAVITSEGCQIITAGKHTYDLKSPAVTPDSVYDVASLTKVLPVSCCALKLIEQGKLALDDQLITFVPEFTGSFREQITVHHLLTHTLDSTLRLSMCKDDHPDDLFRKILDMQLQSPPGTHFNYSNATSILLGLVLESCTGKSLDLLGDEYFFKPLRMTRTGFKPIAFAPLEEIVPSEIDPWRGGVVVGKVHDESAWKLVPRVVGSAGLFSTITDSARFACALLKSFNSSEGIFTPQYASRIITNQLNDSTGQCTGLGWELNQESFMGRFRTASTFGKTGFTGCSIIADPSKMRAGILLSNHIFPQRRESRAQINSLRSSFADCIFGQIN
ncbi:MAG TPA: serine hydrolase domain-containing protein [Chitinispirillaceae bacterium]|nr:serine hydrolase domain-containing protein [Chitinispirillaceae bacterium]